jgi:hypothetical protein
MAKKKAKNSGWDNPTWPHSKSSERKTSNTPMKVGKRNVHQEGVVTRSGISTEKYKNTGSRPGRQYSDTLYFDEHSGKVISSKIYDAKKAAVGNEYPEGCNLAKKDIFEEYPDATVICNTCGFMLEGDTPTIYVDCRKCQDNQIEIKMMKETM